MELRLRRARRRASLHAMRWSQAVEEHAAIVAALEARDPRRLGRMLRSHIDNKLAAPRHLFAE